MQQTFEWKKERTRRTKRMKLTIHLREAATRSSAFKSTCGASVLVRIPLIYPKDGFLLTFIWPVDKHGLVNRFSRVLEESGINHMYSSTFKTANLLVRIPLWGLIQPFLNSMDRHMYWLNFLFLQFKVDKRDALCAQSLLKSCWTKKDIWHIHTYPIFLACFLSGLFFCTPMKKFLHPQSPLILPLSSQAGTTTPWLLYTAGHIILSPPSSSNFKRLNLYLLRHDVRSSWCRSITSSAQLSFMRLDQLIDGLYSLISFHHPLGIMKYDIGKEGLTSFPGRNSLGLTDWNILRCCSEAYSVPSVTQRQRCLQSCLFTPSSEQVERFCKVI